MERSSVCDGGQWRRAMPACQEQKGRLNCQPPQNKVRQHTCTAAAILMHACCSASGGAHSGCRPLPLLLTLPRPPPVLTAGQPN